MTDASQLHRSDAPATSVEAAQAVDTTRLEKEVLAFIASKGTYGATAYECLQHFKPVSNSSINARPSALFRKGLIYYEGDTRQGGTRCKQRVMRAIEFHPDNRKTSKEQRS